MASNPRIDDLRKRLEREPGSRLFAQLAEELRKAGELEEAIGLSLDGLQRHPTYPSARMTLGRCLLDKGDLMGARREFEAVLKGAPDNILACRFLADCMEGLGDLAGAAAQHRAALRLSPGDAQTTQRLAAVEARIASGPVPVAAPAPGPVAGEDADAEPPPIPLAAVDDDAFELERPYEAAPTVVRGSEAEVEGSGGGTPAESGGAREFEMPEPVEPPAAPVQEPSFLGVPQLGVQADPAPPPMVASPLPPDRNPVPPFRRFEGEPAPPWVAPAEEVIPEPPSTPAPTEIASSTLAELYLNQGFADKAIEVYREVAVREPENARARARLVELEASIPLGAAATPPGVAPSPLQAETPDQRRQGLQRAITGLEKVLAAVKKE